MKIAKLQIAKLRESRKKTPSSPQLPQRGGYRSSRRIGSFRYHLRATVQLKGHTTTRPRQ